VAVDVQNLNVRFGDVTAVRDISLGVDFGQIGALLGPNGAGKTTTVETLLGFRSPTAGAVFLHGLNPRIAHREVVTRTGALLQRGGVWAPMSPLAVLSLSATYYAAPRDINELLDVLSLRTCARTPWRRLSGGEQQRVLLALALLGRPRALILDEPTAGVDPEGRAVIRELLRAERERGVAILVTTHDLSDVEALADHVTIVAEGVVRAAGTVTELTTGFGAVLEFEGPADAEQLASELDVAIEVLSPGRWRVADTHADRLAQALQSRGAIVMMLRRRATLEERYLELVREVQA
jgi:ABC-2 type transport system ATP-binding protein